PTASYPKLKGVFDNKDILLNKLAADAKFYIDELIPISVFCLNENETSIEHLSKDSASFMWYQLLFDLLIRLPRSDSSKESDAKEMIAECRLYYEDDISKLKEIDYFEQNYPFKKPTYWYTCDTFLYRLLNKVLRSRNIGAILKFRYFIIELYEQLSHGYVAEKEKKGKKEKKENEMESEREIKMQDNLKLSTLSTNLTVYRGQNIHEEELEKMRKSIGDLMSSTMFMSTTKTIEIATGFITDTTEKCVLFEISVDQNETASKPYLDISTLSSKPLEEEVLFSIGSVFRIMSVKKLPMNKYWTINLLLTEEENQQLKQLMEYFRVDNLINENRSPLFPLGEFLMRIAEYDQAEYYFTILLQQSPLLDHIEKGMIFNSIGKIHFKRGKYSSALQWYTRSHTILKNIDPLLAELNYIDMGSLYEKQHDYSNAAKYLRSAFKLYSKSSSTHPSIMAQLYENIGSVHYHMNNILLANKNYTEAFRLYTAYLPPTHPKLAVICNTLGDLLVRTFRANEALKMYNYALSIQEKRLPPKIRNHSMAKTYNRIGLAYDELKNYNDALRNYYRSRELLSGDDPDLCVVMENIEQVSKKLNK
ncbi:unnamed protein product, partial [Didymodactylos carnosus]